MHGYPVHFLYDKCTVNDRTKGDIIVITGSLFNNLYKLDIYQKFDDQNALAVMPKHKAILNYGMLGSAI